MFKRILLTAAYEEAELVAVRFEEAAEVEPLALRFVIGHKAGCARQIEHAIAAV